MERHVPLALVAVSLASAACTPAETIATAAPKQIISCTKKLSGEPRSFTTSITASQQRTVPITVFAPKNAGTYPLIVFSHGAFATPGRYTAMLEPLAAAGFIIVAPMHIDSEEFPRAKGEPDQPPREMTWATRNEDFALILKQPEELITGLAERELSIDPERLIALGHSYGALIAQLHAGAMAVEPDGSAVDRTNDSIDVVVGWSPPGAMAGFMEAEGWSGITAPNLTLTGTTDIMPPFVKEWEAHKASYENAPKGDRALWVGEGIDHYFGGVFGRVKPASEQEKALFDRALATSLHFIETHSDAPQPCRLGDAIAGETYEED